MYSKEGDVDSAEIRTDWLGIPLLNIVLTKINI